MPTEQMVDASASADGRSSQAAADGATPVGPSAIGPRTPGSSRGSSAAASASSASTHSVIASAGQRILDSKSKSGRPPQSSSPPSRHSRDNSSRGASASGPSASPSSASASAASASARTGTPRKQDGGASGRSASSPGGIRRSGTGSRAGSGETKQQAEVTFAADGQSSTPQPDRPQQQQASAGAGSDQLAAPSSAAAHAQAAPGPGLVVPSSTVLNTLEPSIRRMFRDVLKARAALLTVILGQAVTYRHLTGPPEEAAAAEAQRKREKAGGHLGNTHASTGSLAVSVVAGGEGAADGARGAAAESTAGESGVAKPAPVPAIDPEFLATATTAQTFDRMKLEQLVVESLQVQDGRWKEQAQSMVDDERARNAEVITAIKADYEAQIQLLIKEQVKLHSILRGIKEPFIYVSPHDEQQAERMLATEIASQVEKAAHRQQHDDTPALAASIIDAKYQQALAAARAHERHASSDGKASSRPGSSMTGAYTDRTGMHASAHLSAATIAAYTSPGSRSARRPGKDEAVPQINAAADGTAIADAHGSARAAEVAAALQRADADIISESKGDEQSSSTAVPGPDPASIAAATSAATAAMAELRAELTRLRSELASTKEQLSMQHQLVQQIGQENKAMKLATEAANQAASAANAAAASAADSASAAAAERDALALKLSKALEPASLWSNSSTLPTDNEVSVPVSAPASTSASSTEGAAPVASPAVEGAEQQPYEDPQWTAIKRRASTVHVAGLEDFRDRDKVVVDKSMQSEREQWKERERELNARIKKLELSLKTAYGQISSLTEQLKSSSAILTASRPTTGHVILPSLASSTASASSALTITVAPDSGGGGDASTAPRTPVRSSQHPLRVSALNLHSVSGVHGSSPEGGATFMSPSTAGGLASTSALSSSRPFTPGQALLSAIPALQSKLAQVQRDKAAAEGDLERMRMELAEARQRAESLEQLHGQLTVDVAAQLALSHLHGSAGHDVSVLSTSASSAASSALHHNNGANRSSNGNQRRGSTLGKQDKIASGGRKSLSPQRSAELTAVAIKVTERDRLRRELTKAHKQVTSLENALKIAKREAENREEGVTGLIKENKLLQDQMKLADDRYEEMRRWLDTARRQVKASKKHSSHHHDQAGSASQAGSRRNSALLMQPVSFVSGESAFV